MIRRPFLLMLCALALSPLHAAEKLLTKAPGVVSYTFRVDLKKDTAGTLDKIKALGLTNIEFSDLFGNTPEALRKMLDDRGMVCTSYGTSFDILTKKPDEAAAIAKTLGAKYVRVAWIPHKDPVDAEFIKKLANDFNTIGKALKEQDLTFCYHNHGYEFVKTADGTLFDDLVKATDPALVSYEIDILWTFYPGIDPTVLIEKHGSRFKLMHLKDLKKGVTGDHSGKTDVKNDVALGTGQLDIPAILKAAKKAGLDHYYIEDESPVPWEQVPVSLEYLKGLTE
jgi:sugar phosphate isomerase/epimerase